MICLTSLDLCMPVYDALFADINFHLLLQIRDNNLNLLIHLGRGVPLKSVQGGFGTTLT
jgi:hypothetical protein